MKKNIVTGLDIGGSKVSAVIAEVKEKSAPFNILGAGEARSSGMWHGTVSNLANLTDSIAAALSAAEEKAGLKGRALIKAHNIIANVGGPSVKGGVYEGAIFLSHVPRVVTRRDINKVIGIARDLSISLGEEPVHLIPFGYTLDNQEGIENPLDLYGVKLKVKLYIVSSATNLIRNIAKAVNNAGYEAKEIVYTGIANSSMLDDEEKSDGVALIDIGGHITELAVFFKNKMRYKSSIDVGGSDLTEEISAHFNIPQKTAEDLKIRYGTIYEQDLNIDERLSVDVGQRQVALDRSGMNYLIQSKIKDIFGALKRELRNSGFQNRLPGGIVMSGSPLAMSGVVETAEKEFSVPVRMGTASGVTGPDAIGSNPAYFTSIGLLKYGLDKFTRPGSRPFRKENIFEKSLSRFKELLTDYF